MELFPSRIEITPSFFAEAQRRGGPQRAWPYRLQ
jgi:hypothetical protein